MSKLPDVDLASIDERLQRVHAVDELIDDILLGAPLSIRATKQSATRGMDHPLREAFYGEYPAVVSMMASEDAREGPKAFAEKRSPTWKGR